MLSYNGASILEQFPAVQNKVNGNRLVYLDSAASSLKPINVVKRMEDFYLYEASNVHRGAHSLSVAATNNFESARKTVKNFLGADSESEIIFTSGTTESINLVAHALIPSLSPDDEIVISVAEHHSNIVPWQEAAIQSGAKIVFSGLTVEGDISIENLCDSITPNTKMLAVTHCSNVLGSLLDLKPAIKKAHDQGAKVLVDAAQSISFYPIQVKELNCDFLAFGGHKMFGPYGIGVLYGKKNILNNMVPYKTGGSMISEVSTSGTTYLESPQRFEAGTPNISGAMGLAAAIEFIGEMGLETINKHEEELVSAACSKLEKIDGLRILGTNSSRKNLISFILEGVHHSDLATLMDKQGVAVRSGHHCCQPLMNSLKISGSVRASFSVYNTLEDVDKFVESVVKAKEFF